MEPPTSRAVIGAMLDALAHRGPDDTGDYLGAGVAFGSRRLAIVDLSRNGHMPMVSDDGRFWIIHNGEVYNFRDLRTHLEGLGRSFRSGTDTEVILQMYAEYGPAMLDSFNGMFAFAIWDARERELFIARDRLGVKPLYYATDQDRLWFASEQKALFAAGVPCEFDHKCWEELLTFRYVAGESTPFSGVHRLLPGHYLVWKDGTVRIRRWWNLAERTSAARRERNPTLWFDETFHDAVSLRGISDVPVGVLLSGGIDSSSVAVSLSRSQVERPNTFTVRFPEREYDEGPLAQAVTAHAGMAYHELAVRPDELWSLLREAAWLQDEPLAHGNELHILAISRMAKPLVSVLLSGEGADETLGGYVRYLPLRHASVVALARPVLQGLAALRFGGRAGKLSRFASLQPDERLLFNACDVLPADLRALGVQPAETYEYRRNVLDEARALYPHDSVRQAMYQDQHTFLCSLLDRNDRMTMGASIECRVPFLDYRLVEGVAALDTNVLFGLWRTKQLLRNSIGRELPTAVLRGRKWGFGVPWDTYFRNIPELTSLIEKIADTEPVRSGPFDRALVRKRAAAFLASGHGRDVLIHQLVMITVWYQECVRRTGLPTS